MPDAAPFRLSLNPRRGTPGVVVLPAGGLRRAKAEIASWAGYVPAPVLDLPELARAAGVERVRLVDAARRPCPAPSYAAAGVLAAELARRGVAPAAGAHDLEWGRFGAATRALTLVCAPAGPHARGVARAARRFGARCVAFVQEACDPADVAPLARLGAEVRRVPGGAAEAVRAAAEAAHAEGWLPVFDASWPGQTETPREVMQALRLPADEALDAWTGPPPTHAVVPGGTGALAAAVSVQLRARLRPAPALVVVEHGADAPLFAAAVGEADAPPGSLAWQELERAAAAFVRLPEAAPGGGSGRRSLCATGLRRVAEDAGARAALGLDGGSRVLIFGGGDRRRYQARRRWPRLWWGRGTMAERRVAVVTGASGGIGRHVALGLARSGLHVVLVVRDPARGEAAQAFIARHAGGDATTELEAADLSDPAEARAAGERIAARHPEVAVLVNGAGVIADRRRVTGAGHEYTFAVNVLAPHALTRALEGALRAGAPSRVVHVGSAASDGATLDLDDLMLDRGWGAVRAYSRSKLAMMMDGFEWARRLAGTGVVAHVVHPGGVATGIGDVPGWMGLAWRALKPFLLSPQQGATPVLAAALNPEAAHTTGLYWKRGRRARPNRLAMDEARRERLWAELERLSG